MADVITRLAGPVSPAKADAGTTIYDPSSGTIMLRNVILSNTHASRGAWGYLSIGDIAVPTNRIVPGLYVPPASVVKVPLDLVLNGAVDDIRAKQVVDQGLSDMTAASAVALLADTTDLATYTTASWAAISGAPYAMFVYARAATVPAISSITDTHSGITWTLVDSIAGSLAANIGKLFLYRAQSSGTTNTTTAVTFTATMECAFISIISLQGGDASGTHGSECITKSGASYKPTTNPTVEVAGSEQCGGRLYAGVNQQSTGNTTPGAGFVEIHDGTTATPATAFESSYQLSSTTPPYGSGIFASAVERLAILANIMDPTKCLNFTLNGVVS